LREPFHGQWSARRATYRVIYTIDEDKHLIVIDAVAPPGHRLPTALTGRPTRGEAPGRPGRRNSGATGRS